MKTSRPAHLVRLFAITPLLWQAHGCTNAADFHASTNSSVTAAVAQDVASIPLDVREEVLSEISSLNFSQLYFMLAGNNLPVGAVAAHLQGLDRKYVVGSYLASLQADPAGLGSDAFARGLSQLESGQALDLKTRAEVTMNLAVLLLLKNYATSDENPSGHGLALLARNTPQQPLPRVGGGCLTPSLRAALSDFARRTDTVGCNYSPGVTEPEVTYAWSFSYGSEAPDSTEPAVSIDTNRDGSVRVCHGSAAVQGPDGKLKTAMSTYGGPSQALNSCETSAITKYLGIQKWAADNDFTFKDAVVQAALNSLGHS